MEHLKAALGKTVRRTKGNENASSNRIDGPHWRRSVNMVLQSPKKRRVIEKSTERETDITPSAFLALPKELRHLIEEYLPRADTVCLQQTCQKARYESRDPFYGKAFNARQAYSLRRRFDRDCFPMLCTLESNGNLNNRLAVCSFCLRPHERKRFRSDQLRLPPQERVCSAAAKNYLICGRYWTRPVILRLALDEVLATGREEFRMHHWMPAQGEEAHFVQHIILSRAIERTSRLPERRASLFVDDTGLGVEHHFHVQSQRSALAFDWDICAGLTPPLDGVVPVCPHMTLRGVVMIIENPINLVEDQCWLGCQDETCRTEFAWFECPSTSPGWKDLCVRVRRRFGWVEDLTDLFWESL